MANITSSDNVATATVNFITDADGVYAIQISAIGPTGTPMAVELGGNRIWQGQARTDSQGT